MLEKFDQYFLEKEEPTRSCLYALQSVIQSVSEELTPAWKYRMPFFCYHKKMFCYLWTDKVTKEPYIGIVDGNLIDHPMLEQGERSRMKILRIDPNKDLPVEVIQDILQQALKLRNY